MHVAIRADGGPNIGYGHLVRTSALAGVLLDRDTTVTVATTTPQPAQMVFPTAVEIVDLPSRSNPNPFIEWIDTVSPNIVFTDAYPVDTHYQKAIRERVPLAVLQDDARHAVCADLFVNGNLHAKNLEYEFVGQKPTTCLGTNYVLLRKEIRDRTGDEPPWREQPEHALVMMGGSDVDNLTPTVIRAFDDVALRVDAIIGPGCSTKQEENVRDAASVCGADVRVRRDPDDLVGRMMNADFAVSTASSTTYELLALGTPILSIAVVENQNLIAAELCRRNVATVLERDADKAAFHNAITEYICDPELRRKRRLNGRELVDGNGTERIAKAVSEMATN